MDRNKKHYGSSLFYELTMLVMGVLLLPLAIIHSYLRALVGLPNAILWDKGDSSHRYYSLNLPLISRIYADLK